MTARYIVGKVQDVLAEIPDGSIDLVLTSWPYLGLRSYLPADHPDKAAEIGTEGTPAEYLDSLLAVTAGLRRVLAGHGTIATELGDSFAGSGGAGGDYGEGGLRDGQARYDGTAAKARRNGHQDSGRGRPPRNRWRTPQGLTAPGGRAVRAADVEAGLTPPRSRPGPEARDSMAGWPLDKSLCMAPELYRVALAYGLNPLTGSESPAGRWRVRNVVVHARPNPPVGSLGDKWRPACSYWALACTSGQRWFDLDAVREVNNPDRVAEQNFHRASDRGIAVSTNWDADDPEGRQNPGGAPPLDWFADQYDDDVWVVPTHGYPGAHYATFSPRLVQKFIASMCPPRVCLECGEPSRRIVEQDEEAPTRAISDGVETTERARINEQQANRGGRQQEPRDRAGERPVNRSVRTVGWTDCGHGAWRPGVVLDPFAGSGTTLAVAIGHGRDALGIDLDSRNVDLAVERCGMFLEVDDGRRRTETVQVKGGLL